jgi:hypothetical protein
MGDGKKNSGGKEAAIGKRPIGKGAAEDTAIEKRSAGKEKAVLRNIGTSVLLHDC